MMKAIVIPDGFYFLHPEGGGWECIEITAGRITGRTEESNASTHQAAHDYWWDVMPDDDDEIVDDDLAEAVLSMAFPDEDHTMIGVSRMVESID